MYHTMVHITFPPTDEEHSLFSTPCPAFIVHRLFDDGHSDQCEVISHCSFDLHFSNNKWCWASFHVFLSHLYVLFGEMSVWGFFPLFDWVDFIWYGVAWVACIFWKSILCQLFHFLLFSPFLRPVFSPCLEFIFCPKGFKLNHVPLVYFCFYFHYSRRWVIEDLALIYAIECSAYFNLRVL